MESAPTPPDHVRARLEALVRGARTPAVQYVVLDATHDLFAHAAGWADIRRREPMDTATTLMAYSMSKPVTAAAVLQLVEAGRVELDRPVVEYVGSLPYRSGITVRQLLAHTSGLPNPIPLRWVHAASGHATFDERDALARVLAAHPRLAARPGTRYAYSNLGYWLLGRVVEEVSGASFSSYVSEQVLRPLGIPRAELAYAIPDPARQATGYLEKYSLTNLVKGLLIDRDLVGEYDGRWLSLRSHYVNGPAFGGLVGSARGFARFLRDQLSPRSRLFGETTRNLFYSPQSLGSGKPIPMTLGWHVGDLGGIRTFFKEGGGGGFHSMMRLYPDQAIATVMMANATGLDVGKVLDALDGAFLHGPGSSR